MNIVAIKNERIPNCYPIIYDLVKNSEERDTANEFFNYKYFVWSSTMLFIWYEKSCNIHINYKKISTLLNNNQLSDECILICIKHYMTYELNLQINEYFNLD